MFNKRGGGAFEEIPGILSFIFVAVVFLLFFYGCSISRAKANYEQFEFSKDEVDVIKDLNSFLEKPVDEEQKMTDRILEYLIEFHSDGDPGNFRTNMELIDTFNQPKRLLIIDPTGTIRYASWGGILWRDLSYDDRIEAAAILPVPIGSNEFDFYEVVLQYV